VLSSLKSILTKLAVSILLVFILGIGLASAQNTQGAEADNPVTDPSLEAMCPISWEDFKVKYALDACPSRPFKECSDYFVKMKYPLYPLPEEYITGKNRIRYDFNCDQQFSEDEIAAETKATTKQNILEDIPKELAKTDAGNRFSLYWQKFGSGESKDLPTDSEFLDVTDPSKGFLAPNQNSSYFNDQENGPVVAFILKIVSLLVGFIGVAALLILVVASYYILVANGDSDQIDKGKDMIGFALTGVVIAIFSYAIVTFIQSVLY